MNKLEAAYAMELHIKLTYGDIRSFKYEAIKFRLADKTFYTPDFMVVAADDVLELHEVKGFWEDDARVKIKVFAEMFPFRVKAVTRVKGAWVYEDF
jgi:hypothetical protein